MEKQLAQVPLQHPGFKDLNQIALATNTLSIKNLTILIQENMYFSVLAWLTLIALALSLLIKLN